jgi:phosphoribosylamine--glycine ligase
VTTVVAAPGYPGDYPKGIPIPIPTDLDDAEDVIVFHAGTALHAGDLVSSGGRVLAVTGLGEDVGAAAARSRRAAERIAGGSFYLRRDIGWRELERVSG